jgi:hypothetical protein
MDKEKKRKLAEEVLTDEMSSYTMKHINEIRYLQDWIIDAMIEFSNKVNNVVLDDVSKSECKWIKVNGVYKKQCTIKYKENK